MTRKDRRDKKNTKLGREMESCERKKKNKANIKQAIQLKAQRIRIYEKKIQQTE